MTATGLADYQRTLADAGLFEAPGSTQIELSGKEAAVFLHNLSTNDINGMPLGGGCEAYFCDHRAKSLAHAFIYHVLVEGGKHAFWLNAEPTIRERLVKHLDRHLIAEQVEIVDRSDDFVQFHLAGPRAKAILEQATRGPLPDLAEFMHMERTIGASANCHLRRRDPLGVPGYDIATRRERSGELTQSLEASGARRASAEAFDVLRVEAGTPIYGVDIDENRFVMEVARAQRAVSYSKGCYLGQEPIVMARDRAGHVNRAFLGMKVLEGGPLAAGTRLFRDGQEVGLVTSSIDSPRLGAALAIGYLRRGHQEPGTRLETSIGQAVEVLPFPPVSG